jgi:acyl-CoA synthetase (AMP-forming)/AMP-acid ligase II
VTLVRSEIVEGFNRIRRDSPGRPLVHLPATGTTITADDLSDLASRQLTQLTALGIDQDALVLTVTGNRAAFLSLWLACRQLGIALMPVDGGTPRAELRLLAERFGGTVAIVPTGSPLESLGRVASFPDDLSAVSIHGVAPKPNLYKGAAALKLTSGSTGLPKATFTLESQLIEDSMHITEAMGIRPGDRQLAVIPLSHAYGLGNLAMPALLQGTAIVLREAFVPQQVLADGLTYNVRIFPGVPFMFAHLAANVDASAWPRNLDTLISAGAPLQPATTAAFAGKFGIGIHSFYGTSETGGIAFDDCPDIDGPPSVGRAMPGVTITLRPDEGAPADGGRVHVASSAVSSRYVDCENTANDGFVDGGFLTGDFGRFDSRCRLTLTGRASSFINVAGKKVQPEEVEQVLRSMPGIDDVRVLGAEDSARGQQVVACIVTQLDLSAAEVRHFCSARLAAHKVPRGVIGLSCIPLTERGKTDRAKLEAIVREHLTRSSGTGVL